MRALAAELVRPLSRLRAVILQASANPGEVAVFLFENGRLRGPADFSTLGMRIQNEQSGSTSLFPQPLAIEPIPEEQGTGIREQGAEIGQSSSEDVLKGAGFAGDEDTLSAEQEVSGHDFSRAEAAAQSSGALAPERNTAPVQETATTTPAKFPRSLLESRLEAAIAELSVPAGPPSATVRQGHLALLKRWYYRPEVRRAGEIFFPDAEDRWPIKAILRGIGRVAAKALTTVGQAE